MKNATQFYFFKAAPGNALKMRRLEDASVNPSKAFTLTAATQLKGEDFQRSFARQTVYVFHA